MTFFFGFITGILVTIGVSLFVIDDDNDDFHYRNSGHQGPKS
jgi:16S rRNA C1402 N4-methylase RsmH